MRTIVVASGKGGTGKTTVTGLFARMAAREASIVVVDADVEASNLPLALHAKTTSRTAFSGGSRAEIDPNLCVGCGLCADVCRFGAITQSGPRTYAVDALGCEGCGRCERACRTRAITMRSSSAGEACEGESVVGPIAFGQLGPGEDLSGKLVTEVRGLGSAAAERVGADLVLVDGPPGIGCPLIAAVASADLLVAVAEPTVSGSHDLGRLADIAARLDLPVRVVLNKADLSAEGAQQIRDLCLARDLPLLAEVPFDDALSRGATVLGLELDVPETVRSPGLESLAEAWDAVKRDAAL